MAAPTRNFEYGACAFFIAFCAARRSVARTPPGKVFVGIKGKTHGEAVESTAIVNPKRINQLSFFAVSASNTMRIQFSISDAGSRRPEAGKRTPDSAELALQDFLPYN
jgi:hypothetical protein